MVRRRPSDSVRRRQIFLLRVAIAAVFSVLILTFGIWAFIRYRTGPAAALRSTLDKISSPDAATVSELLLSGDPDAVPDEKTTTALTKFFAPFSYKLLWIQRDDTTAAASVRITGTDARALTRDIRLTQLRAEDGTAGDTLSVMASLLDSSDYPTTQSDGTISLKKDPETGWEIIQDDKFRNLLTLGLEDNLTNPRILTPSEVAEVYLERFRTMSEEDWRTYLGTDDIFSTYSEDYAQLDSLYISKIIDAYDFSIDSQDEEVTASTVAVSVTSIDMNSVLTAYREKLLSYAQTVEAITDDSGSMSQAAADALMEALDENTATLTTPVTLRLTLGDMTWQISDTDGLTNALLGDLDSALTAFSSQAA